ncbi:MAG: EAL domain-containing protein [Pseudomonadales bacterium]
MTLSKQYTKRILVVDDEQAIIEEYLRAFGKEGGGDNTVLLKELDQELFGTQSEKPVAVEFAVNAVTQGEQAIQEVTRAIEAKEPYQIIFMDVDMPPGINGVETAKQIRLIDQDVNIVIVSGATGLVPSELAGQIPPVDKLFFFQKPFHTVECRQLAVALCGKWVSDKALQRANIELEGQIEQRTAQLHELAYFDATTGLPNRIKLLDKLENFLAADDDIPKFVDETVLFVVLDIERFSFINETMGYELGTELLQEVGNRLRGLVREHDIVGRFGSDEFAVVLRNFSSEREPRTSVLRIEELFQQAIEVSGRKVFLDCAIGIAKYPEHGGSPEEVFRCAEAALNRSKRHMLRQTVYYDRTMGDIARQKFTLEQELRAAIESREIQPFFQPQCALKTGKWSGAEALARWIKPDGSVVSPADFVPLAEETGLSDALFSSMFDQVSEFVADWQCESWAVPISINMSPQQLRNPELQRSINSVLAITGATPHMLKFELTESSLMENLDLGVQVLSSFRDLGIGIELDDFGTGYSSLQYLADLPVQALKIDCSFVWRMSEGENYARVIAAIVALGHALNLTVVAEGIETIEQLERLRKYNCDIAQGYLLAKPMPADAFVETIKAPIPLSAAS